MLNCLVFERSHVHSCVRVETANDNDISIIELLEYDQRFSNIEGQFLGSVTVNIRRQLCMTSIFYAGIREMFSECCDLSHEDQFCFSWSIDPNSKSTAFSSAALIAWIRPAMEHLTFPEN